MSALLGRDTPPINHTSHCCPASKGFGVCACKKKVGSSGDDSACWQVSANGEAASGWRSDGFSRWPRCLNAFKDPDLHPSPAPFDTGQPLPPSMDVRLGSAAFAVLELWVESSRRSRCEIVTYIHRGGSSNHVR